jgi:hypothetical protein
MYYMLYLASKWPAICKALFQRASYCFAPSNDPSTREKGPNRQPITSPNSPPISQNRANKKTNHKKNHQSNNSIGLCRRRRWPEPTYEAYATTSGYTCVVRVHNREYQTDVTYESEVLARESAAMRAYLICRNFSVNDGMYPAGHDHGGVVQGIPVAIGTGRKSSRDDDTDTSVSSSGGSWSGGSSPERMIRAEHGGD